MSHCWKSSAQFWRSYHWQNSGLFFIDEIFVFENIRRGAHQLEAYTHIALVTLGEKIAAMHNSFMGQTVAAIVDDLINPSFQYWLAREKYLSMLSVAAATTCVSTLPAQCGLVGWPLDGEVTSLISFHFERIL